MKNRAVKSPEASTSYSTSRSPFRTGLLWTRAHAERNCVLSEACPERSRRVEARACIVEPIDVPSRTIGVDERLRRRRRLGDGVRQEIPGRRRAQRNAAQLELDGAARRRVAELGVPRRRIHRRQRGQQDEAERDGCRDLQAAKGGYRVASAHRQREGSRPEEAPRELDQRGGRHGFPQRLRCRRHEKYQHE